MSISFNPLNRGGDIHTLSDPGELSQDNIKFQSS